MKIVIDIPEEMYTNGQLDKFFGCSSKKLNEVIYTGTPLPKRHGDLIDRSKLVPDCHKLEIHDGDEWRKEYCGVSLMQIELYAEAIIEADRGDAE